MEGINRNGWKECFGMSGRNRPEYAPMLLNQEIILIIKNMSLSQIPRSGDTIRSVFKIMDDASSQSKSSLILLDFPSYLEKNMQSFGDYVVPIHHTLRGSNTPYLMLLV